MLRELLWIANEVLNFPIKNHYKYHSGIVKGRPGWVHAIQF